MTCDDLTREAIERLACGEVSGVDRAALEQHVDGCDGCRVLLDDLRTIRAGMHARGVVGTPPGGDWTPFMARLEQRLDLADHRERRARRTRMRALALAATLVLGIALGTWWTRARP